MAATKAMLKESGIDMTKPLVMLHVANAPALPPSATSRAKLLVDLGFKVDMQAMDFQTFATRRLNTKPVERGRLEPRPYHQHRARPGQPAQQSLPGGIGPSGLRLGLADRSQDRGTAAEIRHSPDAGARKAIAGRDQARAYEQVLYLPLAQFTAPSAWRDNLVGVLKSPVIAALQHRQEVSLAMAKAVADDYLRRIPKAELHCHLAGTLRATTVAELAASAGLALPRPADKLYQWPDFYGFLDVLRLTAFGAAYTADFTRAVYEYVEDAVRRRNLRHVEFFFNRTIFYPNASLSSDGRRHDEGIEAAQKKVRRLGPA